MKQFICFGEVLWDLFPSGKELGGAPANFAWRIASLGHRASLVSSVGMDLLGQETLSRLRENGLDTRLVQEHPELPTGTVNVTLSDQGEPEYEITRGVAYDEVRWTAELAEVAAAADCVCFGTLAQRSRITRETLYELLASAPRAIKVLDLNLRRDCYDLAVVERSLKEATVLKLNEQEAHVLSELLSLPGELPKFARAACERWGLTHCLVTRGAEGLYACTADAETCSLPGHSIKVVDTCGAGDACTAGFVSQLLAGAGLERCCRYGNALGALVASTKGATSYVSPGQVEEWAGITAA